MTYRSGLLAQARLPPRAPWWRLAWSWRTLLRLRDRAWRRRYGIVRDPERWAALRGLGAGPDDGRGRLARPPPPPVPLPLPAVEVWK